MSDTAQNPNANVNDIWSMPDPPVQVPQANTSSQNSNGSQTQDDANAIQKHSSGGFGKPGLAGSSEGGGGLESDIAVKELLNKARREETEHTAEVFKAPEILKSPEAGENLKPAESQKSKEEKPKEPEMAQSEEVTTRGEIIDKRTGKERTHRVDDKADKVTKTADIKEQEFIEGVEQVHSII